MNDQNQNQNTEWTALEWAAALAVLAATTAVLIAGGVWLGEVAHELVTALRSLKP